MSNNLLFVSTSVPCLCVEDLNSESKENQWMGVTVNSQGPGGKIVVRMCVFISDYHSQTEQLQFDIKKFRCSTEPVGRLIDCSVISNCFDFDFSHFSDKNAKCSVCSSPLILRYVIVNARLLDLQMRCQYSSLHS